MSSSRSSVSRFVYTLSVAVVVSFDVDGAGLRERDASSEKSVTEWFNAVVLLWYVVSKLVDADVDVDSSSSSESLVS